MSHDSRNDQKIAYSLAKDLVDRLNAYHGRGAMQRDFYDSVVAFEKGQVFRKEAPQMGRELSAARCHTDIPRI
jgi:hypothetical protein